MSALAQAPAQPPSAPDPARAALARVSWLHAENMDYGQWLKAGRRLGEIGRGSQWWIGDWLMFGTEKWGERYSEASRLTGYDPKSLRNMRYVASRFPASLRRDTLNWSHHALLAGLEPQEQRHWLDRAVADRLSVEDLRSELRGAGRGRYEQPQLADGDTEEQMRVVLCPNCGSRVTIAEARREEEI